MTATNNTMPQADADDLFDAFALLDRTRSDVIAHNAQRMNHPLVRAWLTGVGREPSARTTGMVSSSPAVRLEKRLEAGEAVTLGDVFATIVKLQKDLHYARAAA
ncbi:MAG: hypothetical protein Q7J47_04740 [Azoarcus sp.]|nr:hypothetical protein [Azoarcus sp.]